MFIETLDLRVAGELKIQDQPLHRHLNSLYKTPTKWLASADLTSCSEKEPALAEKWNLVLNTDTRISGWMSDEEWDFQI